MKNIDIEKLVNQIIISLQNSGIEFYDKPLDEKDIDPKIKEIFDNLSLFDNIQI